MARGKVVTKALSSTQRYRMLEGKKVTPVLYNGRAIGHGKFMAASVDGQMLYGEDGIPLPYNSVGELQ